MPHFLALSIEVRTLVLQLPEPVLDKRSDLPRVTVRLAMARGRMEVGSVHAAA